MRPEKVKRIARELIKKYPNKFTSDFEENKKILSSIAFIPSVRLRNSIAGYITRLATLSQPHVTENPKSDTDKNK